MPGDVKVNPYSYQGRAAGVPQTRFHSEVCSAVVSKDSMAGVQRVRSRMGVEGLWGIMAWAMTSASSSKTSSGEAEGEDV